MRPDSHKQVSNVSWGTLLSQARRLGVCPHMRSPNWHLHLPCCWAYALPKGNQSLSKTPTELELCK